MTGRQPDYQNLKKYKKTQKKGLLDSLKGKETLTEDDIAAVLAHELGHVLMKIKHPNLKHKMNEGGADLFSLELLKGAGYCPAAASFLERTCALVAASGFILNEI